MVDVENVLDSSDDENDQSLQKQKQHFFSFAQEDSPSDFVWMLLLLCIPLFISTTDSILLGICRFSSIKEAFEGSCSIGISKVRFFSS